MSTRGSPKRASPKKARGSRLKSQEELADQIRACNRAVVEQRALLAKQDEKIRSLSRKLSTCRASKPATGDLRRAAALKEQNRALGVKVRSLERRVSRIEGD